MGVGCAPLNPNATSSDRIAELESRVRLLEGATCVECQRILCGHEAVTCVVVGLGDAPRCIVCVAVGLGTPRHELIAHVREHVAHRECFHRAWSAPTRRPCPPPGCPFDPAEALRAVGETASRPDDDCSPMTTPSARWDAGDLGCGDLVLELRLRLRALEPGQVLELVAADPGAPEDLPAWCRMTGHALVHSAHPVYRIRRS